LCLTELLIQFLVATINLPGKAAADDQPREFSGALASVLRSVQSLAMLEWVQQ
jgi:hypothetical protein